MNPTERETYLSQANYRVQRFHWNQFNSHCAKSALYFKQEKLLHHFKSWCLLRYSKMQFKENKCVNLMQNRLRCCIFKCLVKNYAIFLIPFYSVYTLEYTFVFKRLELGLWHKENDSEFHQARSPHDTILPTNYSDIGAPSLTAHVDHKDTSLTKGR